MVDIFCVFIVLRSSLFCVHGSKEAISYDVKFIVQLLMFFFLRLNRVV